MERKKDVKIEKVKEWIESFSETLKSGSVDKIVFDEEMKNFLKLYRRGMIQDDTRSTIAWEDVEPIHPSRLVQYSELVNSCSAEHNRLKSIACLKLCGGLGTSMGLQGPKALVKVKGGKCFLDFAMEQVYRLNRKYGLNIPLLLMTSFFTHESIEHYLKNHNLKDKLTVVVLKQKRFPRLYADSMLPISDNISDNTQWCPPGHGDVYDTLLKCQYYEKLKNSGISHVFISNIDNLGAHPDLSIFNYVLSKNVDFCLEVTRKTLNDTKGGTVIEIKETLRLLEVAQVPQVHLQEFYSIEKFRIFNTNSMWVSLSEIEKRIDQLNPPVIFNRKVWNGKKIIQLETACGAVLENFDRSCVVQVPRIRRTTVKNTQDLFLAQSGLYKLVDSCIFERTTNPPTPLPVIKFIGEEWKSLEFYESRIGRFGVPDISKLEELRILGDVELNGGGNFVLKGKVEIDGSKEKKVGN